MSLKINILHLYYDIMNLYGERGNVAVLQRRLEDNGFDVCVSKKTITDIINFNDFDIIYIGSGTESGQMMCAKHLQSFSVRLKEFAEQGKIMLATGNAFEILGRTITSGDGESVSGAGLFDFEAEQSFSRRVTGDVICSTELIPQRLVGFVNKCSTLSGVENGPFKIEFGPERGSTDGARRKNVFGTHLIGPLLVKNPYFLEYIVKLVCDTAKVETMPQDEGGYRYESYRVTLRELSKRAEGN